MGDPQGGSVGQQEGSGPGGWHWEQPSHAGSQLASLSGEQGNEGAVCPGTAHAQNERR